MDHNLARALFSIPTDHKHGDTGTVWNLDNYDGELYTADQVNTPFLTMVGGMNGGLDTSNFEFPTASLYSFPDATQPDISETASLTAPAATHIARSQEKNVVSIYQETVDISYAKQSNGGRLSGINTAGAGNNVAEDEAAWQISKKLQKIARDFNYACLNGTYQIATAANVSNKSRGMYELCSGGTTIAAAGAQLTKKLLNTLLREMFDAGATFQNTVIFCKSYQKQMISDLFGYAPADRNVGGVNINQIETDFGMLGIALDRMNPAGSIGIFEMSVIAPVFQPVPKKGRLFYEALGKSGASEKGQLYGQMGLDHGPAFMHGSITGLATEDPA